MGFDDFIDIAVVDEGVPDGLGVDHGHGAANLQYGFVGKYLFEELPTPLEIRKDGTPIYTMALATGVDRQGEEHEWRWQMRPEVAAAIRYLGLTQ